MLRVPLSCLSRKASFVSVLRPCTRALTILASSSSLERARRRRDASRVCTVQITFCSSLAGGTPDQVLRQVVPAEQGGGKDARDDGSKGQRRSLISRTWNRWLQSSTWQRWRGFPPWWFGLISSLGFCAAAGMSLMGEPRFFLGYCAGVLVFYGPLGIIACIAWAVAFFGSLMAWEYLIQMTFAWRVHEVKDLANAEVERLVGDHIVHVSKTHYHDAIRHTGHDDMVAASYSVETADGTTYRLWARGVLDGGPLFGIVVLAQLEIEGGEYEERTRVLSVKYRRLREGGIELKQKKKKGHAAHNDES